MSWNKLQLALVLLLAAAPQLAADALSRHPSGSSSSDTSDDASSRHPTSSASSGDSSYHPPAASTSESEPSAASRHPSGSASSGESRGSAEGGDDGAHRTHRQHNDEGGDAVDAVVDVNVSSDQSVSDSVPTAPRPKRSFWVVGIGAAPLGVSLGWMHYDTEQLRYGVLWQRVDGENSYAGGEVAWAPGRGDVSPYVSVGLGLITTPDAEDDASAAAKLEAGLEILHHDNVRVLIGANTILRLGEHGDLVNTSLHVRVCF